MWFYLTYKAICLCAHLLLRLSQFSRHAAPLGGKRRQLLRRKLVGPKWCEVRVVGIGESIVKKKHRTVG